MVRKIKKAAKQKIITQIATDMNAGKVARAVKADLLK